MNTWFVRYKCGRCGSFITEAVDGEYKSQVVRTLTPKLHSCQLEKSARNDRIQGIALPIEIWERKA